MKALKGQGNPQVAQPAPRREARRRITVTPPRFHCRDDGRRANASATMNRELRRARDRAARRVQSRHRRSRPGCHDAARSPDGCAVGRWERLLPARLPDRRRTVVDSTVARWPQPSGPATGRSSRTATAGVLWGIDGVRGRARSSSGCRRHGNLASEQVVVHRGTRVDRADRTTLGPIPITTPVRTLIDLAGRLEDDRLLAVDGELIRGEARYARSASRARLGALRESGSTGRRTPRGAARRARRRPAAGVGARDARCGCCCVGRGLPLPARQHWVDDRRRSVPPRLRLARAQARRSSATAGSTTATRSAFGQGPGTARPSSPRRVGACSPVTWDVGTRQTRACDALGRDGARARLIHCRRDVRRCGRHATMNRQSIGTLRTMRAVDAVEDLVEAVAGDGEAVVALADDGARRVGRLAHELGDRLGELDGAARVVDLGGDGALDPRVHVEDRADARGARGRSSSARWRRPTPGAARRPSGTRSSMTSRVGVVAGDEQDVAADLVQRRLVDAARAHPVLRLATRRRPTIAARAHVAVAQPADAVEQLHVAQVAVGEDLLDRERRRAAGRARRAARRRA